MTVEATRPLAIVVRVDVHLWARYFSAMKKNYLDRKLIRVYTCAFAFSK